MSDAWQPVTDKLDRRRFFRKRPEGEAHWLVHAPGDSYAYWCGRGALVDFFVVDANSDDDWKEITDEVERAELERSTGTGI